MLAIDDPSILIEFDERERSAPSPHKIDGDRVIHTSQQLAVPKEYGRPTLCDFGEARLGGTECTGDIQPWFYRAPEVILDLPWNNKVDMWNLGVMVCPCFSSFRILYLGEHEASLMEVHLQPDTSTLKVGLPHLNVPLYRVASEC